MSGSLDNLDNAFSPAKNATYSPFTYPPLPTGPNSFRLLQIMPSLTSMSSVRCNLFNGSPDEHIFIAGSYVWGPPAPTKSIFLNGLLFRVRQNLYYFLQACRNRTRPCVMWIDALCINHDDNHEKSCQVRAMGKIYSSAQAVYCWLGWTTSMPTWISSTMI